MTSAVEVFVLLDEERSEKVTRKALRDFSNPLVLPEIALNKEAFRMVLDTIEGHLSRPKILLILQLATSLRFLAEGSHQRSVGNDLNISVARSTVSTILSDVLNVMERFICRQLVQLEMDNNEK